MGETKIRRGNPKNQRHIEFNQLIKKRNMKNLNSRIHENRMGVVVNEDVTSAISIIFENA